MVTFIVLLNGCAPALYVPSNQHVSRDATLDELTTGRLLYAQHCNSCHNLYVPDRFTEEAWKTNIDSMQVRAKLQDEEKSLILKYILAGKRNERVH